MEIFVRTRDGRPLRDAYVNWVGVRPAAYSALWPRVPVSWNVLAEGWSSTDANGRAWWRMPPQTTPADDYLVHTFLPFRNDGLSGPTFAFRVQ